MLFHFLASHRKDKTCSVPSLATGNLFCYFLGSRTMAGAGISFNHTNNMATTTYDIGTDLDLSSSGSNTEGTLQGNFQQVKKKRKKSNSKGHMESNGNVGNSSIPRELDMEVIAN